MQIGACSSFDTVCTHKPILRDFPGDYVGFAKLLVNAVIDIIGLGYLLSFLHPTP